MTDRKRIEWLSIAVTLAALVTAAVLIWGYWPK